MKKFSVTVALVLLVASATWVMAGPRGRANWEDDTWCPGVSQLSALNLSAEQSEKIRGLRESFVKEITPIRTQLFTKKTEMSLLWIQTGLDADKIRATQKEIQSLMGQMQEKTTDFRLAFRNLLTPEQTSQLLSQDVGRGPGSDWGRGKGSGPGNGCGAAQGRGPGGCW
ncbi:MAG: Spy/CpxP family protein refolding chaperone [Candidatus Desulfacyla sp.]